MIAASSEPCMLTAYVWLYELFILQNKLIGQCFQATVTIFKQISALNLHKILTGMFKIVRLSFLYVLLIE